MSRYFTLNKIERLGLERPKVLEVTISEMDWGCAELGITHYYFTSIKHNSNISEFLIIDSYYTRILGLA